MDSQPEATATCIIALVGPTAVGKSALALDLARRVNGEIVNADSMQGYIGMDIGTAKPSPEQRRQVRHHVIDEWTTRDEISVVEFRNVARTAINDIARRKRTPIVVGGSWLYVQAIVDEMDFPPTDPAVRARWEEVLSRVGPEALHDELRQRDARAAADIEPSNARRIVRALEVIELTGTFRARLPQPQSWQDTIWLGMDAPRNDLDILIERRVERMWNAGFVDEVSRIRVEGWGRTAAKALGYAQISRYLDGEIDEATARMQTVASTVKFARRQQRRFRQDARIHWLNRQSPRDDALTQVSHRIAT